MEILVLTQVSPTDSSVSSSLGYVRYKYCVYIGKASSQEDAFHHIIGAERNLSFLF